MRTGLTKSAKAGGMTFATLMLAASVPVAALGAQLELASVQSLSSGTTLSAGATVTYTVAGTSITIDFGPGSFPSAGPVRATVLADSGVENSVFSGNYIERAINTIRFEITDSGVQPFAAAMRLQSGATPPRIWESRFTTLGQSGSKRVVSIPLKRENWTTGFSGNLDAMFAQDIQNVAQLSIVIWPGTPAGQASSPAQTYKIESLVLVNDDGISSSPATLSSLEKALIARFGYGYGSVSKLTSDMKSWDADGDGMADYVEIQCENDQAFANAMFAANSIKVVDAGAEITWTCVKDETYTVLRTDAAGKAFAVVVALSGLVADDTGYMTRTDTAIAGQTGPFFYRILKY